MNEVTQLSDEAIAALGRGNKIEAIKITREKNGLGLKEAKDVVEAYAKSNPVEARGISGANSGGTYVKLFVVGLIGIVAYIILK